MPQSLILHPNLAPLALLETLHNSINSIARNNFNKSSSDKISLLEVLCGWPKEKKYIIKVIIKSHLKLGQPKIESLSRFRGTKVTTGKICLISDR